MGAIFRGGGRGEGERDTWNEENPHVSYVFRRGSGDYHTGGNGY